MPICDIIIRKHQTPERVNLLDGRQLLARYNECATRGHLPPNVRMRRCCKQRAAPKGRRKCRCETGRGLGSLLRLSKKLAKNCNSYKS